jgi:hypothetical protein
MIEPFAAKQGETKRLLAAIAAQLDTIVQQLAAGLDVAPAQRLQLEGLTAAGLLAGIDTEFLLEFCRQRIPANAAVQLNASGSALQFDLWQVRAPVYPTTAD